MIKKVITSKIELIGPINNMNFKIDRAFQFRGLLTKSLSTLSHGIANWAKS
jgi:hypothetical protein